VLLSRLRREFFLFASELEARLSAPNDRLSLRKRFLRVNSVEFGTPIWIGRGFHLIRHAPIVIGQRCAFGEYTHIIAWDRIVIGDDFLSPGNLYINSGTHETRTLAPRTAPINIGKRVWCGANVTILAGVSIGNDVVIGAGSVVVKDVPENSIAVGVPAVPVGDLDRKAVEPLWRWSR
jgi:acetyltransferase-like isoleucine patch superfamily enzyme